MGTGYGAQHSLEPAPLYALYPGWRRVWRITLICLGVSLVIETMQLYLPWRHPGVEDLMLNTLGGAAGAWAGIKYWLQKEHDSITG